MLRSIVSIQSFVGFCIYIIIVPNRIILLQFLNLFYGWHLPIESKKNNLWMNKFYFQVPGHWNEEKHWELYPLVSWDIHFVIFLSSRSPSLLSFNVELLSSIAISILYVHDGTRNKRNFLLFCNKSSFFFAERNKWYDRKKFRTKN